MKKKDLLGKGNTAEVFEYENGRVANIKKGYCKISRGH